MPVFIASEIMSAWKSCPDTVSPDKNLLGTSLCPEYRRWQATTMTGAYSFICDYSSTDALCARLNQVAWKWRVGDSYWYGDYVAAVPFPGVRIRIVDFPGLTETGYRYESDIRIGKECTTAMEEIDAAYRNVLAQLPAHDIREIEWFD